jgi:hypothetical protein
MDTFLVALAILAGVALFILLSVNIPGFASGCARFLVGYLKWSWNVSSAVMRAFSSR